jgi:predicted DCC family thiol-disulfide oxidoreductase YuxK
MATPKDPGTATGAPPNAHLGTETNRPNTPGSTIDPISNAAAAVSPTRAIGSPWDLPAAPLVLYDGDCGLCAASVQWLLAHERDHAIVFAPLQGPTAQLARRLHPEIPALIDSVVYVADGRAHLRSKALLYAAAHLRAPWHWAYAMRWVPGAVLDLAYRVVAALRFRIWGHADACQLVTPEQRRRFLP